MSRDESIYEGFCEIVAYTKNPVEVEVEDGKDEYGDYVIVHYKDKHSSKIRFSNSPDDGII